MQHLNDSVTAEKQSAPDILTARWPKRQFKYHWEWVAQAVELEDAMNIVILNPRNIQAKSLLEADSHFLRDKNRYRKARNFVRDREKRAKIGAT